MHHASRAKFYPGFSVYLIPLFRGKIIFARNAGRKRLEMQVCATRGRKSVEAGLEISMGRLVLNYDVDKMSEDMSREIPTFRYRALSRVRIYAPGTVGRGLTCE